MERQIVCLRDNQASRRRRTKTLLDFSDDHFDRYRVVAAARDDDVCVTFARLDELEVHRLHRGKVLIDDLAKWPASRREVALDSADEANVRIGIDENFHVA